MLSRRRGSWFRFAVLVCILSPLAVAPNASAGTVGHKVRVSENPASRSTIDPSLAFDANRNRYLAVWAAETTDPAMGTSRVRIFGRFISGDGQPLGHQFEISRLGPPRSWAGNSDPVVVYNRKSEEFLVVWNGVKDDGPTCADGVRTIRILGQRLTESGHRIGPRDFGISDPASAEQRCARDPSLVYNQGANEYLVIWGTDTATPQVYGQRLDRLARAIGAPSFRVSQSSHPATDPSLTFDPIREQYLAVWEGGSIVGQRLSESGAKVGTASFQVGGDSGALNASATFNPETQQFLVVWQSSDIAADSFVKGQRVGESGRRRGKTFLVSDPKLNGAVAPTVAYNPSSEGFEVVFNASETAGDQAPTRVFGQDLGRRGKRLHGHSFAISGPSDDAEEARTLVWNSERGEFLTAWESFVKESPTTSRHDISARRLSG
jgi:hypothetical protein